MIYRLKSNQQTEICTSSTVDGGAADLFFIYSIGNTGFLYNFAIGITAGY
jgi:hypothetical protein